MGCKELAYILGDYIDGTMEPHLKEELDAHIAACEPCINFLRTYTKTRELARKIEPAEIPLEVRERLKSFVMEKAREHYAEIEKYVKRAAEERRRTVIALIDAFRENRLTPTLSLLFETHKGRCPRCGGFIESLKNGKAPAEVPAEIEEHLAEFVDALPPGESFPGS